MLVFFRARVRKPDDVSNAEWYGMWAREAEATLQAIDAGVITAMYKVAGRHEVLGFMELATSDDVDHAIEGLPLLSEGYSHAIVDIEFFPVRPYQHWAEHLKDLAAAGTA
jgi:muconolactone delta-isomerase